MTPQPSTRTYHDYRLPPSEDEVIDRSRPLRFTWNGEQVTGYAGDTISSALAATGTRMFSRSMKYHRPRGMLTASMHDPGCILQVGDEPNVRASHRLLEEGMEVSSQNTWPSLKYDARAINQLGSRFLAPGFYYKTFMKPKALWPVYERVLRKFVHAGTIDPQRHNTATYQKRFAHTDVLVAGGGLAGMTAALAAARTGARVMLVEEEHQLGGHLRWHDPAMARDLVEQLGHLDNVRVLTNATVAARYDDNWCAVFERWPDATTPERLTKTRAASIVVATGLIERPYVFEGNDLPGVLLSTAVRKLINLYSVCPGTRAVVLTANEEGDAAAADLRRSGATVVATVDARRGENIVRAHGPGSVQKVELADGRTVEADLLVTATGWTAPTALLNMAGDHPVYSESAARFLPGGDGDPTVFAAGGLAGDGSAEELGAHAEAIGVQAASASSVSTPTTPIPDVAEPVHPALFRSSSHGFIDYSEDVSSKDLYSAVREGYDSAELAKRYTTVTMGPMQGKLELINAIAVIADATGTSIAETGTTTWRPMHSPVTLGALAGPSHDPVRYSAIQPWHQSHGAVPLVAGQWIRPEHYGDPEAEVRAVRERVGIIDVTPLGKLDLRGADVPKLLNLLYTNKWSALDVGRVRYGAMCSEDGVVFDDGVTAHLGEDHYLMTTTSSGAAAVWDWIEFWLQTEHPDWDVSVTPVTTAYTSINVAGPQSRVLLSRLVDDIDLSAEAFGYMRVRTGTVASVPQCVVWRIGFTGELSYEIHVPADYGLYVWQRLLEAGADLGVQPFGVEAQRVLRLEKGHLIVGQDTDGLTKGFSAGLGWAIKLDKEDFVGKPELVDQLQRGTGSVLVGIQPVQPGVVPAEASQILHGDGRIGGRITSSRFSPTLNRSVCLGQVDRSLSEPGTVLTVQLPDARRVEATVMPQLAHVDPASRRQDNHTVPELAPGSAVETGDDVRAGGRSPERCSAVRPTHSSGRSGVTVADESLGAKLNVQADPTGAVNDALGVSFGRATRTEEGYLVMGASPGEWLIFATPGTDDAALKSARDLGSVADQLATLSAPGASVSTVDVSHGRAVLRLGGEGARQLMSHLCAVDLADSQVPDHTALRTSVAGVTTDIVRDDVSGARGSQLSFILHCERSVGQYLYDTLVRTAESLGI